MCGETLSWSIECSELYTLIECMSTHQVTQQHNCVCELSTTVLLFRSH